MKSRQTLGCHTGWDAFGTTRFLCISLDISTFVRQYQKLPTQTNLFLFHLDVVVFLHMWDAEIHGVMSPHNLNPLSPSWPMTPHQNDAVHVSCRVGRQRVQQFTAAGGNGSNGYRACTMSAPSIAFSRRLQAASGGDTTVVRRRVRDTHPSGASPRRSTPPRLRR